MRPCLLAVHSATDTLPQTVKEAAEHLDEHACDFRINSAADCVRAEAAQHIGEGAAT